MSALSMSARSIPAESHPFRSAARRWRGLLFAALALLAVALVPSARAATPAELETGAREFVRLLDQKKFDDAALRMDPKLRDALPPEKLGQVWDHMIQLYGPLKAQGETRIEAQGDYQIVFVRCEFTKGPLEAKVVFDSEGRVGGLFFAPPQAQQPQEKAPDSVRERAVTVGKAPWELPGTLTLPAAGAGPWPGVVLVGGSGPQDREESIGAEKPFRDLAWDLAARGIAVLRYDKRTFAHRDQRARMRDTMTINDEVDDDAVAAAALLADQPEVDGGHVFLAGHSLGAMMAPRIADRLTTLAGLILIAPPARLPHKLMLEQANYLLGFDGKLDAHDKEQISHVQMQVDAVDALLRAGGPTTGSLLLGAPPSYWLSLRGYDPAAAAAALAKTPILILHGGRDYQVTANDMTLWHAALDGHANVTFKDYPKLNHLMIAGEGPSSPNDYAQPGHVDADVIAAIANWIHAHAGGAEAAQ